MAGRQCGIIKGGKESCPGCEYTRTNPAPEIPGKCNSLKKDSIHRCTWLQGQGTEHPGAGRCKYHGGNTPSGRDSVHFKNGLYTRVKFANLGEIAAGLQAGADPFDLRSEIAMLRSIAAYALNKGSVTEATEMLLKVTKAVEKLDIIERGRKLVIDTTEVTAAVEQIIGIIQKHVKDKETLDAISRDLARLDLISTEKARAAKEVEWVVKEE